MYDINSLLIAGILLVSMIAAIEIGFRVGTRGASAANDGSRTHINAVLASLLGILALLLGFTFSLALQRYDSRSAAVVDEANAIGTAYLRASLLHGTVRGPAEAKLREYVDLRVQASVVSLDHEADRLQLVAAASRVQEELWALARQAAAERPDAITALFASALNDMFDALGTRDATLARHVPEVVLLLVYGTFLMAALILGYSSGMSGHRASFVSNILVGLIVCLVFIIIDLDRPRRGIIEVSQHSLVELQGALRATP